MHERYDPHSYPESCFDDDFCLKPPVLLWVTLLFLSRGAALPIVFGLGRFIGVNADALTVLHSLWKSDALIPAAFAAPVLYSLVRRVPSASRPVRWIWAHGRALLVLSVLADLTLAALSVRELSDLGDALPAICAGVADAYLLLYLLAARRIRDSFADFPPPVRSA
jgi:hypothetical protein